MTGPAHRLAALLLALACGAGPLPARAEGPPQNAWSRVTLPSGGGAMAIGGFAHGCIAGAEALPLEGTGYEVIRPSRRRYFGHPETIGFVERLGVKAERAGLPDFFVGDMAQPRGGPLPFGHASHQTGLDVDIWFEFESTPLLRPAAREDVVLHSMLLPSWRGVDPQRFGGQQIELLRLAANDPQVDRIFVNPVIKATLCRRLGDGDRTWLRVLRPWWGHDDHFHVRLRCPPGSPACESQAPVPPGDGCDATLQSWVRDQRPPPPLPPPTRPRIEPRLPAACRALLAAP